MSVVVTRDWPGAVGGIEVEVKDNGDTSLRLSGPGGTHLRIVDIAEWAALRDAVDSLVTFAQEQASEASGD